MIAFGPVPSRRLGRSLGINNIPPKICTYLDIPEAPAPTRHLEVTIGWVREARIQVHHEARTYLDEWQRNIYRQGIAVRALRWRPTALARCSSCVIPQRPRAHCNGGDGFGPRLGEKMCPGIAGVEPILAQLERGGLLVMAPVSASPITIEDYSENLWGRDIRTLYNLKRSDAEEFFAIVDRLDLGVGTTVFPFDELPDALILAKQGKLSQPNAVIEIAGSAWGPAWHRLLLEVGSG